MQQKQRVEGVLGIPHIPEACLEDPGGPGGVPRGPPGKPRGPGGSLGVPGGVPGRSHGLVDPQGGIFKRLLGLRFQPQNDKEPRTIVQDSLLS